MRDKNPVIMGLIGALLLSTPAVAATADDFTDFPSDWSAPALSQAGGIDFSIVAVQQSIFHGLPVRL